MNDELEKLCESLPVGGVVGADQESHKSIDALIERGPAIIANLVKALDEAALDERRARVVMGLHNLAVRASAIKEIESRSKWSGAFAAELGKSHSHETKEFLIRELQVCGGDEVIDPIAQSLSDTATASAACQALIAIGPSASPALRKALPQASGRARVEVAQALGKLRDAESAEELRKCAASDDQDLRVVGLSSALANIGSQADAELLLSSAANAAGAERGQLLDACFLLAQRLTSSGDQSGAARIFVRLGSDPAPYIAQAATRELQAIGK